MQAYECKVKWLNNKEKGKMKEWLKCAKCLLGPRNKEKSKMTA